MNEQIKKDIEVMREEYLNTDNDYKKYQISRILEEMQKTYPNIKIFEDKLYDDKLLEQKREDLDNKTRLLQKKFVKENKKLWKEKIPKVKNQEVLDYHFPLKDIRILMQYLEKFFENTSEELFAFYTDLKKSGRILLDQNKESNQVYYLNNKPYIFVNHLRNMLDISLLINKIGYAYYNYVNKDNSLETFNIDSNIKKEIPGKTLELLFIHFLYNNAYSSSVNLNRLFISNIQNDLKIKDAYLRMQKELANYVAYKYLRIKEDILVEDFFQMIYHENIRFLLEKIENIINKSQNKKKKLTRK